MQRNTEKPKQRRSFQLYNDSIDYFLWLCGINDCTQAEMFERILTVFPKANADTQKCEKPGDEAQLPIKKEYGS